MQAETISRERPSSEELEAELREALEDEGHRFTAQRAAVYRVVGQSRSHPTADEIFTQVRNRIPDISLATVYKALEAFVSCDLVEKLTTGEGPARYDGRTDRHHHVRCVSCGSVSDVEGPDMAGKLEALGSETDFEVVDYRLELLGRCPGCRS